MKTFDKTVFWFLGILTFLTPIFLLVFPGNVFPATRLMVIFLLTALAFGLWAIKNFLHKGVLIVKGNFYAPFLILFALILISILTISSVSAMNDAIFGTAGMFILMMILGLSTIHLFDKHNVKSVAWGLASAGVFISLTLVLSYFSLINKFIPVNVFSGANFINNESAYYLIAFFVIFLSLGISYIPKKENMISGVVLILSSVVGVSFVLVNYFKVGNSAVFLPFSSGWAITIEIFKNLKNLLFGIGFNQFALISPLFKTAELNSDKYVFMRFPQTSNGIFEIINSLGILGFLFFCFLIIKMYKAFSSHKFDLSTSSSGIFYVLPEAAIILSFFFLPFSPIMLFLFFLFFALIVFGFKEASVAGYEETKLQIIREGEGFLSLQTGEINAKYQYAPKIFAIFGGILAILIFYFVLAYPVIAESHFASYLVALARNDGRGAYEEINAAVGANPKNDKYYIELSRVNFQLALSLNAQKKISDQDRQNITILVNQSIAAAQRATDLNPNRLANWENLAALYQSLITTDVNSIGLSSSAYQRAIALDPQDPALRVSFAQMLYAAKAYQDAINQLNLALSFKSDYANAYYNLGLNYKTLGQNDNAKRAFELAQKFVKKGSNDEKTIKEALAKIDEVEAAPTPSATAGNAGEASESGKLTTPDVQPEIGNLKKDLLRLETSTQSATPTP